MLGIALLVTALGAAFLVTGFAGLLLRPGTLAVVPPIVTAIPPGGLRIRGCCDHHASACEKRYSGENWDPVSHFRPSSCD